MGCGGKESEFQHEDQLCERTSDKISYHLQVHTQGQGVWNVFFYFPSEDTVSLLLFFSSAGKFPWRKQRNLLNQSQLFSLRRVLGMLSMWKSSFRKLVGIVRLACVFCACVVLKSWGKCWQIPSEAHLMLSVWWRLKKESVSWRQRSSQSQMQLLESQSNYTDSWKQTLVSNISDTCHVYSGQLVSL